MASRLLDGAFLAAALIALLAFGLLIVLARPPAPIAAPSASVAPTASFTTVPPVTVTVAPATTAPATAAPATAAPTPVPATAVPTPVPTARPTAAPTRSP